MYFKCFHCCSISRVDVSDIQRWSALIQKYFQVCFSAVHYLKISKQRWKRKFSELKISAETALFQRWFSLKQRWFLNYSERHLFVNFSLFSKFSKYINFGAHNSGFQPSLWKELSSKYVLLHFRITYTGTFRFTATAQVTKQIWFNFSKTFLRLQGWNFKIIPRNLSLCRQFAEFLPSL